MRIFLIFLTIFAGFSLVGCQDFVSNVRSKRYRQTLINQFGDRFRSVDCSTFAIPETITDAICGYVTVPEFHDRPDEKTIKIAVTLFPNTQHKSIADPLVMIQGGPGASTLSFFPVGFVPQNFLTPLQNQRDIILIEQRGTRYSQPSLFCPEVRKVTLEVLSAKSKNNQQTADELNRKALINCRDRLQAEGVNFSAYNGWESAADLAMVFEILGYDRVNFYGISYGAEVAQLLMKRYPDRLRTVILDAVAPTSIYRDRYIPRSASHALREVFSTCLADKKCNQNYPELEKIFFQVINNLNRNPITLAIDIKDKKESFQVLFNGDSFLLYTYLNLYNTGFAEIFPKYIYEAKNNQKYDWIAATIAGKLKGTSLAKAAYHSYRCAQSDYINQTRNPFIDTFFEAPAFKVVEKAIQRDNLYCELFAIAPLPQKVYAQVSSEIPTLLMNGQYDPILPLPFSLVVAQNLSNASIYNYPNLSHGSLISGYSCPVQMVSEFIENPDRPPNEDCIAEMKTEFIDW
ncbi:MULTISPECIES: alpha/beta hydrolase [Spirulina sp. CCY15215]|uniref:alpha/beta hydrolase n=1 Tax=Spirulina sp. CCY15215 TaxID=2767591 RepID=UPI00194F73FB|nr:alpha/beta hydrolase [Spirulina major]